ncbi:MAG: hypothetical protein J6U98_07665 [Abditibacteriota bacterium]|nr:hypothetical protein [Abditibacteriota bacterium]
MRNTITIALMAILLASAPLWAEAINDDCVVVTDYGVKSDGKTDVADAIQKVIDTHPNKTIYFPDGTYLISKPICTPADPAKSVSLRLDNYAVIKASPKWSSEEAMIRLGGKDPYKGITVNGSNYSLTGGIIDGNVERLSDRAVTGVSIDSGRETVIRNVSIKHVKMGIHLKLDPEYSPSDADITDVNIVGTDVPGSVGVLVEGTDNTFTDMRIASVFTGVHVKSGGNCLRNIHPLFIGPSKKPIAGYEDSAAFRIEHPDNWLIYCYNDQFATGFEFTSTRASACTMDCCFCFWYYRPKDQTHTAIRAKEKFIGVVTNFMANFSTDESANVLLDEGKPGGDGVFRDLRVNENIVKKDDAFYKHVEGKLLRW